MTAKPILFLAAALASTAATAPALAAQDPVTPYPAAYFADAQPYSAFDMLGRLPVSPSTAATATCGAFPARPATC